MTQGAGIHVATELLLGAGEQARKAVAMLAPDEIWTASSDDLVTFLRTQAELDAVSAAAGHLVVREVDVRDVAGEHDQASTKRFLGHLLTLTPGEAKARVKTAEMLCRKAPATLAKLPEGKLNRDQARAIAEGLDTIDPHASAEDFPRAEAALLRDGIGLHAGHITRL